MKANIAIKPISINKCFQGRRFRTAEFKNWQEAVFLLLPNEKIKSRDISIGINIFLKSIVMSDIDNFLKPIIDCIVKKGIIEDDRYINELNVKKIKSEEEGFEVIIKSL